MGEKETTCKRSTEGEEMKVSLRWKVPQCICPGKGVATRRPKTREQNSETPIYHHPARKGEGKLQPTIMPASKTKRKSLQPERQSKKESVHLYSEKRAQGRKRASQVVEKWREEEKGARSKRNDALRNRKSPGPAKEKNWEK